MVIRCSPSVGNSLAFRVRNQLITLVFFFSFFLPLLLTFLSLLNTTPLLPLRLLSFWIAVMSAPQPDLPEPVHAELDSMLSRKFGKEVANYFSGAYNPNLFKYVSNESLGSPLNRVSFLRTDHLFLSLALKHPSTSFLLFKNLEPLVKSPTQLAYASYKDVQPIIEDDPYSESEEELIKRYSSAIYTPQLIFLGLDDRDKESFEYKNHYKGAPFFALDITPKEPIASAAESLISRMESNGLSFSKGRMHLSLPAHEGTYPLFPFLPSALFLPPYPT